MSEYQYYRFERLEGRLDKEQLGELRQISSRAKITATAFQVSYDYSDLDAEPQELVLSYFDIGFYFASWGAIIVYIKLPFGTVPDALTKTDIWALEVYETEQWQLLVFNIEEYEDYFHDGLAEAFFQHIASLRQELIQGNSQLLYFMWLKALSFGDELVDIPLIYMDFNQLSVAQSAFAQLYDIPLSLVKALQLALADNPSHQYCQLARKPPFHVDDWLSELTHQEKDNLLRVVIQQGHLTCSQALSMTRKESEISHDAYQYWLNEAVLAPYLDQAQSQLKQEQAAASAQQQAIEKAEKEDRLLEVFTQRENMWEKVQAQASLGHGHAYDRASDDLHQLAEAYQFKGEVVAFKQRLGLFLKTNSGRKALLTRLSDLRRGR